MGLALTLLAGCAGERGIFAPETNGGVGGPSLDAALVGQWQTVLLVSIPDDWQTWTTDWTFNLDGSCHFTRTVRSLAEGGLRVTDRDCRWTSANSTVTATYTDGSVSVMPYSFPNLDRRTLELERITYTRVR